MQELRVREALRVYLCVSAVCVIDAIIQRPRIHPRTQFEAQWYRLHVGDAHDPPGHRRCRCLRQARARRFRTWAYIFDIICMLRETHSFGGPKCCVVVKKPQTMRIRRVEIAGFSWIG